jgi:PTH1 family peptidyl-tRNA hydrolase
VRSQRHGGSWRREPRFDAELARVRVAGTELWLVKPQAYMNRSGGVTAAVANFYKIPAASVLVVHDELDLLPGVVRLKQGGGSGGHNGLKDLIAHLGEDFWRLRLGIGRPVHKSAVADYVLEPFSPTEALQMAENVAWLAGKLPELLTEPVKALAGRPKAT